MIQQPPRSAIRVLVKPSFDLERRLIRKRLGPVAGVDEAGRGPLAGPVAVAAVILDPAELPDGLDDSKALSAAERDALYPTIFAKALSVSVSLASAAEIDAVNIRQATLAAMRRAVAGLALAPRAVLVDGRDVPPAIACHAQAVVRGDAISVSIAAASIVAKVTRDRLMARLAKAYPDYGFDMHKGYGTSVHTRSIALHGPCPFHRMTFAPLLCFPCSDLRQSFARST